MKIIGWQHNRHVALVSEGDNGIRIHVADYPNMLYTFGTGPADDDHLQRALRDAKRLEDVLKGKDDVQAACICAAVQGAVGEFIKSERKPKGKRRV
jgi:predicted oxidoreductase